MGEQEQLVNLQIGQAVINEKLSNMEIGVNAKHVQNRSSIHDLNNKMQLVIDDVWKLKIKIVSYSSLAGAITTLVVKLIEHFVK
jgi:hypothetical protein